MARIKSRQKFKEYVLSQLGSPLLDLPIQTEEIDECDTPATTGTTGTTGYPPTGSAPTTGTGLTGKCAEFAESVCTQLDFAIDDALDYFHDFASDMGNEKGILYVTISGGQQYYDVPECIVAMEQDIKRGSGYQFDDEEAGEGVGLFSLQSQFGPRGVFSYLGSGSYDTLLTYDIAQQYNNLVDLRYSKKWQTEFLKLQSKVFITPTPTHKETGRIVPYYVSLKVPDEKCFNNIFVQRYATALAMVQIGRNLSLYTGLALPGGGNFNAAFYWDMGKEAKEKLEDEMLSGKWGSPPPGSFFTTG